MPENGTNREHWTPGFLAFVVGDDETPAIKAEDVLGDPNAPNAKERREEWGWISLAQRLHWLYGAAHALARLNQLCTAPVGWECAA